jgi:hypothetical protein
MASCYVTAPFDSRGSLRESDAFARSKESPLPIQYARPFPPGPPSEDEAGDYLSPKEFVDPDEEIFVQLLREGVVRDTRQHAKHAGKNDAAFHEPHWGHTTGLLQGTLALDRIEALPERFRVGLFAQNRSYPVVARPNVIENKKARFIAGRLAVKLRYPRPVPNVYAPSGEAHELDLLFGEGAAEPNGFGRQFFFRDARELAMFGALVPPSGKTLATLANPGNWSIIGRVFKRLKALTGYSKTPAVTGTGWSGKSYFSAGPYALGDGAMKLCLRPRQAHPLREAEKGSSKERTQQQRAALQAWAAAGKHALFDLGVQLATPGCIPAPGKGDPPKSVMAAEYCDLTWDESKSPYLPVGTLTFEASAERDLSEQFPWSPLEFNAWNTLPEMRPLGQLFRARKHVHKAHAELRLQHIYDTQPGAMVDKAPFARDAAE